MTPEAVHREIDVFVPLLIDMACLAWKCLVRPDQRKSGARMALRHVRDEPRLGGVTPFAGATEFVAVNVLMTTGASRCRPVKLQRLVTLTTRHLRMLPLQGVRRARVVKLLCSGDVVPGRRGMTVFALKRQIAVRRGLSARGSCRNAEKKYKVCDDAEARCRPLGNRRAAHRARRHSSHFDRPIPALHRFTNRSATLSMKENGTIT